MDISQIKTWVFDLDGVIWRGDSAITGAAECVSALQERGCRTLFASNNSTRAPHSFASKLSGMNIRAAPADIVTSTTVTVAYLRRRFPDGGRVFIVGEAGLRAQLEGAGFEVVQANQDGKAGDAGAGDAGAGDAGAGDAGAVIAVVAGLAREFCYADLARAQHHIFAGALFIATNRDATFPIEGGVLPGAGAIVAALETASGRAPLTMGKPEPAMLTQIVEDSGLPAAQTAMIGDRLDTDIACAHRAGTGSVWVATGVVTWEQARAATGEEKPDLLLADLTELTRQLKA